MLTQAMRRAGASLWRSHWLSFVFLLPFWIMFWVHQELSLTDAFLKAPTERDRVSSLYNLTMFGVMFVGVAACAAHALYLYSVGRRWEWLGIKALALAVNWAAVLLAFLSL